MDRFKLLKANTKQKLLDLVEEFGEEDVSNSISGHFWIVRDGKIVDWDFPEYKELRVFHNCEEKPKYRLESVAIRRKAKKQWIKEKRDDLEEIRELMPEMWEEIVKAHPLPFQCSLNVCVEQALRGGQIAYGDMGWTCRDTGDIWYEFEHSRPQCGKGEFLQIARNIKAGRKTPKKYGFPPEVEEKMKDPRFIEILGY
jgi:hypothetical protein